MVGGHGAELWYYGWSSIAIPNPQSRCAPFPHTPLVLRGRQISSPEHDFGIPPTHRNTRGWVVVAVLPFVWWNGGRCWETGLSYYEVMWMRRRASLGYNRPPYSLPRDPPRAHSSRRAPKQNHRTNIKNGPGPNQTMALEPSKKTALGPNKTRPCGEQKHLGRGPDKARAWAINTNGGQAAPLMIYQTQKKNCISVTSNCHGWVEIPARSDVK